MSARSPLHPLHAAQLVAADPAQSAWVSASAGAGKTQVLTARVLRLMLDGARPEGLLCLTYTKAAAAEMQNRIFARLAQWVRAPDEEVARDLEALGCRGGDKQVAAARRLFARALDSRGGLRVQTLHSFAQSVLASFPVEAGVPPGFEVLDERTSSQLARELLADVLTRAHRRSDTLFLGDIAGLSIAIGEARLSRVLDIASADADALGRLGIPTGYEPALRGLLGVPRAGAADAVLAAMLRDEAFECQELRSFALLLDRHGGAKGPAHASAILGWLECDDAGRCRSFEAVSRIFMTKEGTLQSRLVLKKMKEEHSGCEEMAERLYRAFKRCSDTRARLELAARAALHLRVGAVLSEAGAAAKSRAGALDFDDVIAAAARLLGRPGLGDWVRFKLDQAVEHVVVDEGQDTNARQWSIIEALAAEFFAGEGRAGEPRTLFAVGDFKQAIFGFQGSEPRLFEEAHDLYRGLATAAGQPFETVELARNFRSSPPVLAVVDSWLATRGHEALGLTRPVPPHEPARRAVPGLVALWPPVMADEAAEDEAAASGLGWMPSAEVREAQLIARQIRHWLDEAPPLPARGRAVTAGDILVLVRKRSEFVSALVAALHEEGVPVAGSDRLKLTEPLAVRDLLSLIRFALQPEDDLTLAELLVSPLIGWSQEQLLALAQRRPGTLWRALRDAAAAGRAEAASALPVLEDVLSRSDLTTPYRLLESVLSGQLNGRSRLLERLGGEARDAIEELLNQALLFEQRHAPTLTGFLDWVTREDVEVKRDPDTQPDAVRIMTVHGAKGLQAPVVILADAAKAGDVRAPDHVMLDVPPSMATVPIFFGGQAGHLGPVKEAVDDRTRRESEEDLRLLYVALTRAEDMLFVAGALGKRDSANGGAPAHSWHAQVGEAMRALGATARPDALWKESVAHGDAALTQSWLCGEEPRPRARPAARGDAARGHADARTPAGRPGWAVSPPPAEAAPPRPLSPSRLGPDDLAAPPAVPGGSPAASRGKLLHLLLERLPRLSAGLRETGAARLVAERAPRMPPGERDELVAAALAVLHHPSFGHLFGDGALAEAPIAALVGDQMISGTVDRLLVEEDRVLVVDYKTGHRVPETAEDVPAYYVRQMAAYRAALGRIFPGRRIEAALLFTEGLRLVALPDALLEAHAPHGARKDPHR
jgi:ATP-dependent helicase/nuclease subunit A